MATVDTFALQGPRVSEPLAPFRRSAPSLRTTTSGLFKGTRGNKLIFNEVARPCGRQLFGRPKFSITEIPPKVAVMIAIGHTSIMILLAVVALAAIGVAFSTFTRNPRD
jgi:hypothetical protein